MPGWPGTGKKGSTELFLIDLDLVEPFLIDLDWDPLTPGHRVLYGQDQDERPGPVRVRLGRRHPLHRVGAAHQLGARAERLVVRGSNLTGPEEALTLGFRKYLRKYAYRSQKVPLARREISGGGARLGQIHTSRNSIRKMGVLDTSSF